MSYQTPLTINKAIQNIDTKKYFLPSIQREFVWNPQQIEKLFDSLMRGYPISTFLFWEVPKNKVKEFQFYEFLRDYHQLNNRHNTKASLSGSDDITAILDGQQRLTSLYIALKGSYAYKLPRRRWNDLSAYPKRKLYINLCRESEDPDFLYDFAFLTDDEAKNDPDNMDSFWFPVGEILNFKQPYDVNKYLIDNKLMTNPNQTIASFSNQALSNLQQIINDKGIISYYLEQSTELDKVLNIFIRVNSGGTTLSYSDLLLSFATAQWSTLDAREEINNFTDEVNSIGRGFNIGKDIILKSCLVLSKFSNITFKVDNFNKTNMLKVEKNWSKITDAFRKAVELISSFGFSRDNVTSNNAFIPIAYYIYSIGTPINFVDSSKYADDRMKIKKWFISSLLRKVFSFMPDGVLKPIRDIIDSNQGSFPLQQIVKYFKGTNRDISFNDESIENLLWTKYGSSNLLLVLSILYPWADLKNNFHVDHMYPKCYFTEKRLLKAGVQTNEIQFYIDNVNYIGNLQLLEGIPNQQKSSMFFDDWLKQTFKNYSIALQNYKDKQFVPNVNLEFTNFEEFMNEREELIREKLKRELM